MDSTANCDSYFTQNTDISGIGVRAAFYLQVLLIRTYRILPVLIALLKVYCT